MMTYIDRMTNSTDAIILTYVPLCKIYYTAAVESFTNSGACILF